MFQMVLSYHCLLMWKGLYIIWWSSGLWFYSLWLLWLSPPQVGLFISRIIFSLHVFLVTYAPGEFDLWVDSVVQLWIFLWDSFTVSTPLPRPLFCTLCEMLPLSHCIPSGFGSCFWISVLKPVLWCFNCSSFVLHQLVQPVLLFILPQNFSQYSRHYIFFT